MSDTKTIYFAVTVPASFTVQSRLKPSTNVVRALEAKGAHVQILDTSEAIESEADRIKRAAYFSHVRVIVDDVMGEIKSGNITDREGAIEYIEQSCDSSYYVTYTHAIFETLRYSEHHDAYTEELGEAPVDESGDIKWPALAYMALRQDVFDLLDALGIDINTDDLGVERTKDDETED